MQREEERKNTLQQVADANFELAASSSYEHRMALARAAVVAFQARDSSAAVALLKECLSLEDPKDVYPCGTSWIARMRLAEALIYGGRHCGIVTVDLAHVRDILTAARAIAKNPRYLWGHRDTEEEDLLKICPAILHEPFCRAISFRPDHMLQPPVEFIRCPQCSHCNRAAERLGKCKLCQCVAYCSRTCQEAAWPKHRRACPNLAAERRCRRSTTPQAPVAGFLTLFFFFDISLLAGTLSYCAHCGTLQPPLRCATCLLVAFCNRTCQRAAWPNHKPHCCAVEKPDTLLPTRPALHPLEDVE